MTMSSGSSEDFYSTDEVKVYKDEGNKDEEKRSSENLNEEKLGLVTESEEGKNSSLQGNFTGEKASNAVSDDDKANTAPVAPGQAPPGSLGFFLPPYASTYPNGSSVAGKFGMVQPPYPGLVMYNEFAQPPPAHKGYPPVYTDPKTGLPRPSMYAAYPAPGQFPHPLYSPEFTGSWRPSGYPLTSGAFAGSFPPSLTSSLSRYSGHPGLLPHPSLSGHPAIPHPSPLGAGPKSELMSPQLLQESHRQLNSSHGDENSSCKNPHLGGGASEESHRKKPYVKKPLNAFMLFMKEMRPKVISECTLKESAAINQILGRRWHALDRAEQAKYYEMARKEKELHLQLYPGWSARDNYAVHQKKKKRKKEMGPGGMSVEGAQGVGGVPPPGMGGPPGGPVGGAGGMMRLHGMGPSMRGSSPMEGMSVAGGPVGARIGGAGDMENKPGECVNEKKCRARYGMDQQSMWCKPCRRKKKCIRYKQTEGEHQGSNIGMSSGNGGHHHLNGSMNGTSNNNGGLLDRSNFMFNEDDDDDDDDEMDRTADSSMLRADATLDLDSSVLSAHNAAVAALNGHRDIKDRHGNDDEDGRFDSPPQHLQAKRARHDSEILTNGAASPLSPIIDEDEEDCDVKGRQPSPLPLHPPPSLSLSNNSVDKKALALSSSLPPPSSSSSSVSSPSSLSPPITISSSAAASSSSIGAFSMSASSPRQPSSSSSQYPPPPHRYFTQHTVDSFLFSPPPPSLRIPHYPLHPPSPLAATLPVPYLGFPPLPYALPHSPHALPHSPHAFPHSPHAFPHSPHTPKTPTGSPYSADIKHIL